MVDHMADSQFEYREEQDYINIENLMEETKIPQQAKPKAANNNNGGGGKKMKSRRYLKDPKKFKTYISKLRNKTAKKEVELINSIRELKNM